MGSAEGRRITELLERSSADLRAAAVLLGRLARGQRDPVRTATSAEADWLAQVAITVTRSAERLRASARRWPSGDTQQL